MNTRKAPPAGETGGADATINGENTMNFKILLASAVVVNLAMSTAPAVANGPTREECYVDMVRWFFETELLQSLVKIDGDAAITFDEEVLDRMPPHEQERVLVCMDLLAGAPDPEDWPFRDDEEI